MDSYSSAVKGHLLNESIGLSSKAALSLFVYPSHSHGYTAASCSHLESSSMEASCKQSSDKAFIRSRQGAHRGVGRVPEEANHLGVRGRADEGHVAVSERAIDLQVEASFGRWISVLSEGLHSVSGQVEVEAVGTDLRSGYLKMTDSVLSQWIWVMWQCVCRKETQITAGLPSLWYRLRIPWFYSGVQSGSDPPIFKPELVNFQVNDINQPSRSTQQLVQPREIAWQQRGNWVGMKGTVRANPYPGR